MPLLGVPSTLELGVPYVNGELKSSSLCITECRDGAGLENSRSCPLGLWTSPDGEVGMGRSSPIDVSSVLLLWDGGEWISSLRGVGGLLPRPRLFLLRLGVDVGEDMVLRSRQR